MQCSNNAFYINLIFFLFMYFLFLCSKRLFLYFSMFYNPLFFSLHLYIFFMFFPLLYASSDELMWGYI